MEKGPQDITIPMKFFLDQMTSAYAAGIRFASARAGINGEVLVAESAKEFRRGLSDMLDGELPAQWPPVGKTSR